MAGQLDLRVTVRDNGDELDRLAANLNAMLDRIQSLMESLKQVSSDIAHDLRTPLARLRQNLETAKVGARSVEEFRSSTDAAIAETDALLKTFSALLRIAQIESGSRKAGFAKVDLSELFELVALTFAAVAEDQGHQLVSDIARWDRDFRRPRASPAACHEPRRERHSPHPQRNQDRVSLAEADGRGRRHASSTTVPAFRKRNAARFSAASTVSKQAARRQEADLVSPWWPPLPSFMARALACSITRPGLVVEVRFPASTRSWRSL